MHEILVLVFFMSLVLEYMDSTLGMGYGTTLTPLLLMMGFAPLSIVPAMLLSQLVAGAFAAFMHHRVGNVHFDFNNDPESEIVHRLGRLGYVPRSMHSKVALVLALCSLCGAVVAVLVAVRLPTHYLKLFIGIIVLSMGILILARRTHTSTFSWSRMLGLGVLAAFNKGLSGGGYGPLVTSGQILCGIKSKNSIAITALAESFTCLVGVLSYLVLGGESVGWSLAPFLVGGALLGVPLSAHTVKRMKTEHLTMLIGVLTAALGTLTLYKTLV